jgi:branched-chain amino acid transport system permease protein
MVRSIAVDLLPGTWQMILGSVLLLTILFLPDGLGSVASRFKSRKPRTP